MDRKRWAAVDAYITGLLVEPDPGLDAAVAARAAAGLPAHDVSPNEGKLLYLLASIQGARAILEIGTLAGYSTIWLARALPPDGRLVTLEGDPRRADVARANVARAGLTGVVDVRVGPALDTLPQVAGPFDLVFIDADKRNNPGYLEWSLRLSRPGTLIIADNVVRGGAVADRASPDPDVQGVRRFNELIAADSRLTATAIQTVGAKGWDGFALVLVAGDRGR
ncbi:MAG TPA: O-methyltransferase [bacterium]|nr:O-methyltransferase [bacterium]